MHIYFDTAPAAAARDMTDGHQYVYSQLEMYGTSTGQRHVRCAKEPRLMRVSHIADGVAFAEIGKAGDAIACLENLPFGAVTKHVADERGALQ